MKFMWSYIKKRCKIVLLCMGAVLIFGGVFYLYNLPVEAVSYAALLTFVFLLLVSVFDFLAVYRKQKELEVIQQSVLVELPNFSAAGDDVEKQYQEMVKVLFEYKIDLEGRERIGRQEMTDYYSMWAHQIKTPISAMRLLLQSKEGEQSLTDKELRMELFKIEQYVEMVLSYVRMEGMSADIVFQWYKLDDLIRQALRKYAQMFILKKISLDFKESGQTVLTDEKWILFVLEQILSNALKYTKEGTIRIYMDEEEPETLVIEDTGIGIWEEDIPRVFEKGFTGYNGRTDKKSTGIGLYLCKRILDKLGHRIWIASEVSKGTKVYIGMFREERKFE